LEQVLGRSNLRLGALAVQAGASQRVSLAHGRSRMAQETGSLVDALSTPRDRIALLLAGLFALDCGVEMGVSFPVECYAAPRKRVCLCS